MSGIDQGGSAKCAIPSARRFDSAGSGHDDPPQRYVTARGHQGLDDQRRRIHLGYRWQVDADGHHLRDHGYPHEFKRAGTLENGSGLKGVGIGTITSA